MTQRTINVWLPLGGIVLAAWLFLALMSLELARIVSAGALGPGMSIFETLADNLVLAVGNICRPLTPEEAVAGGWSAFARVTVMWAAMAIAMMLPTAIPLVATYAEFSAGNPAKVPPHQIWGLIGGYIIVWLAFAILAAGLQVLFSRQMLLSGGLMSAVPGISVAFLLAAGIYQFSPLKTACLAKCRAPFTTFMSMWRNGMSGAFIMGLRQGLYCLGCCWALMLLAFLGGIMNIVWMALAMSIMLLEKLPGPGKRLTWPLGALLIAAAGFIAMQNLIGST